MVLEALQIGLVVSISGIIAISLFTLYLLDQLGVKVKSIETILKEMKQAETQRLLPSEPAVTQQSLQDLENKLEQSNQSLKEQVEGIAGKTSSLGEELAGLNENNRAMTDSIAENKGADESLRTEVSAIMKKYDELEKLLTEMVRRSLRAIAQ